MYIAGQCWKWVLEKICFKIYTTAEAPQSGHLSAFKPNPTEHMMLTAAASIAQFCHLCPGIYFPYDKILLWVGPAEEGGQKDRGKDLQQ